MRVALAPAFDDALASLPAPPPAPEPRPEPHPRTAGNRSPAFPAPMDIALGHAARRRPRGTGGVDTTPDDADLNSPGEPPRDPDASSANIRVRGAHVGKDWLEQLHEWWEEHSYYPDEAARLLQDGTAQIHVHVDRYGRVHLVELESSSGSQWLDAGAQAVFRNATLPPFPPGTLEPDADLDITIDYILQRRR